MYKIIDYFFGGFSSEDKNQAAKKDLSAKEENTEAVQEAVKMHLDSPALPSAEGMKLDTAIKANPQSPTTQKVQEATVHLAPMSPVSDAAVPMSPASSQIPPRWDSFEQVTRYLPNCEELLRTHGRDAEIDKLVAQLQGNYTAWIGIIERYRQMEPGTLDKDALKAFAKGKIAVEQFCTLTYCAALLREFPGIEIQVQPLFNADGTIDPVAKQLFEQGLYREGTDDEGDEISNFFERNEAMGMVDAFFENMQDAMPSERCFFSIPVITPIDPAGFYRFGEESLGLRVLSYGSNEGKSLRMIPSFSMISSCVKAYGKENTINPWPTINLSTREDYRRNLNENGRDMYIPFIGIPVPQTADGFRTSDSFEFIFHDLYHCLICSQIPEECRIVTGHLADITASLLQTSDIQDVFTVPFLETLYGRLVDSDFSRFGLEYRLGAKIPMNLSKGELFLLELQIQIFGITLVNIYLKLKSLPPLEKTRQLSAAALAKLQPWYRLQEEVNREHILHPGKSKEVVLYDIGNAFFEKSGMIAKLCERLYSNDLLDRLDISPSNLNYVQSVIRQNTPRLDDRAFLIPHLLRLHNRSHKLNPRL